MVGNRGEDLQNPDYSGLAGRAWKVELGNSRMDMPLGATAVLGAWLIEAPLAHRQWSCYRATLSHLRHIPGAPPIENIRKRATHEFTLGRIRPEFENAVDIADIRSLKEFYPPDVGEELILPSDERALEAVGRAIQSCVEGELNPSPGDVNRKAWRDFLLAYE